MPGSTVLTDSREVDVTRPRSRWPPDIPYEATCTLGQGRKGWDLLVSRTLGMIAAKSQLSTERVCS